MRLDSFFTIVDVKGEKYILPYGPNAAEYKTGVKVDDVGQIILEGLAKNLYDENLTDYVLKQFELGTDMREQVSSDILDFCKELQMRGMLVETDAELLLLSKPQHYLNIAGLNITVVCDDDCYHDRFKDFEISEEEFAEYSEDIRFNIVNTELSHHAYGGIIVKNRYADVYECDEDYTIAFTKEMYEYVSASVIHKSKPVVDIFFNRTIESQNSDKKEGSKKYSDADFISEKCLSEIFDSMRQGFFYHVAEHGMHVVHSCSLLYDNKAWLFSGPSGTGKSTHVGIWQRVFDVPMLNGDVNLVANVGKNAVVYGIPWCGTSETYTASAYELGGIILLKQSKNNRVVRLAPDEQVINISNRFFSPNWKKSMVEREIKFASELVDKILVCRLECNMDDEAAITIKRYIDKLEKC